MSNDISVVFIGDIVGEEALYFLVDNLNTIKSKYNPDFIVANGENVWNGKGINEQEANTLFNAGINVITTGNHIWENWKSRPLLAKESRVIRPINYPIGNPGYGYTIVPLGEDTEIAVIQLQGRTYMQAIDDPFSSVDVVLEKIQKRTNKIIVDFHAEATAEKIAMAWHLDGKVSSIFGTHTHVQTADAQILPGGTGYITDVGMTGPYDSVLGMDKNVALNRFKLGTAHKFELAKDDHKIAIAHVIIDSESGLTLSINSEVFPDFSKSVI